jgi:phosphatidylserine/phosphatidylglycerophosphate/cardiolipin synthase-like enzyme
MKNRSDNGKISVNAIAGTAVVLLGLNAEESAAKGLLGFRIFKKEVGGEEYKPLYGGRTFENANNHSQVDPIQSFMWGDYTVLPNTKYTYKVLPVYGTPVYQQDGDFIEVEISTEDTEGYTHAIYFNRGVAGSQAYSRHFGEYLKWYNVEDFKGKILKEYLKPADVPNREAYKWLSRGLEEAMLEFIGQAKDSDYSLRAAVYEFTYIPAVKAFVDALERGADVKIIHHAKQESETQLKADKTTDVTVLDKTGKIVGTPYKNKNIEKIIQGDSVCQAANRAVDQMGITDYKFSKAFNSLLISRTDTTISHNKFIVLLKNGNPIQVWTGSTNFTEGGIFGQSNVGHIIRDEVIAQKYLDYWQKLSTDPEKKSQKGEPEDTGIANWNVIHQADFSDLPAEGSITPIFSPRTTNAMLDWYANQLGKAKNAVFFTAAFSVANPIFNIVKDPMPSPAEPYLRYLLLEGINGQMKDKYPIMAKVNQNRIAWGDLLKTRKDEDEDKHHQSIETLTGLNDHVNYLHTKYMLVDPLSKDPLVITGSANFSDASTTDNDENMVVIRGDTRVADIFLGEFMRLFNHFRNRNISNKLSDEEYEKAQFLASDDSWLKNYYTDGTQEKEERLLFGSTLEV